MNPAIFLDRDGVINHNRSDYVKTWEEYIFLPNVFEPLKRLAQSEYSIVIIRNQSPIGRGLVQRETVEAINQRMKAEIESRGGRIDGVYYCPHRPDEVCECRKPRPGLLLRAAQELDLDLSCSYFIGDAVSDVEAALAAGCTPLFVQTGLGSDQIARLAEKVWGHRCDDQPPLPAAGGDGSFWRWEQMGGQDQLFGGKRNIGDGRRGEECGPFF